MTGDDPTAGVFEVVLVPDAVLDKTRRRVLGCDQRSPDDADVPFDWLFDDIYGTNDPPDYLALCPRTTAIENNRLREVRSGHKAISGPIRTVCPSVDTGI